jgi:5-methylcytosine-specific restriction endonuclease McrA
VMQAPHTWREFVARLSMSQAWLSESEFMTFADDCRGNLRELLAFSAVSEMEWQREVSLIALLRAFLTSLPASVIERPEEPCRDVVRRRLQHLLGEAPDEEDLASLMRIVKQIQLFRIHGRRSGGLDISFLTHRSILKKQAFRCANCGYRFSSGDLSPDPSSGELPRRDSPLSAADRSPRRINRRAVLDHRFPIYLAGDKCENWQILCFTCNNGKGDTLFGFEGRSWFGRARLRDLTEAGAQLFYMVLR